MNWDGPRAFTEGVDAFLARLSPHGQIEGTRTFPKGVDRASLRFQGRETIKHWFDRCVNAFMSESLEHWQLEENLAAFAVISWKPTNELDFVTINVLKTECSLRDYFNTSEQELARDWPDFNRPRYIRLDLDYGTLGPIGSHPLPHVHFSPDDGPRCALDTSSSSNVVVDFVEFVYRQFFHQTWLSWAERAWNRYYRSTNRNPDQNPFSAIVSGFAGNDVGAIHALAKDIAELMTVLTKEKARCYQLRMNESDRQIMTFPDSHG